MLLAARGSNLEATDNEGQTPISQAAEEGHLEVVKELADRGANLEAKDRFGLTPFLVQHRWAIGRW